MPLARWIIVGTTGSTDYLHEEPTGTHQPTARNRRFWVIARDPGELEALKNSKEIV